MNQVTSEGSVEKRSEALSSSRFNWDQFAKIAGVFSAIFSTLGLLAGGAFGLYTYREQSMKEVEVRQNEIHARKYMQLKEVYGQLVDAAAAVGSSQNKEEALVKLSHFDTIYFGRAHIFIIDDAVVNEKIEFYGEAHKDVHIEAFPSRKIQKRAEKLGDVCRQALDVREKLH